MAKKKTGLATKKKTRLHRKETTPHRQSGGAGRQEGGGSRSRKELEGPVRLMKKTEREISEGQNFQKERKKGGTR